jgi:hypothetical protein
MSYYSLDLFNRDLFLITLQVITIYNAMKLGWDVEKIDNRTYKLSKNISELSNFKLNDFINRIVSIRSV